jgi:hypothetical protein
MIDQYCNRTWNFKSPVVEYFDQFTNTNPPVLADTFFPSHPVSLTPANPAYPQAGGIISIVLGKVNGQGGTPLDLTYVYSYKPAIKFWTWFQTLTMFNPIGYRSVEITYNSNDAQNVPNPIKMALVMWCSRLC